MMNLKSTIAKLLIMIPLVSFVFMQSSIFADTLIELEFGYEALEEYKSFELDGGYTYESLDPSIAKVDNLRLVAVKYGDTVLLKKSGDEIIEEIDVVVYLVGDEPVPWGSVKVNKQFVSGYPNQTFKPKHFITRAEVATMFSKILDLEYTSSTDYLDLLSDHWAYDYIQSCVASNLMSERTSDEFYPDAYLTRREFARLIYNYTLHQNINMDLEPKGMIIDVIPTDPDYYSIHGVINARLMSIEGRFNPDDFITRGDVVNILSVITEQESHKEASLIFKDVQSDTPYFNNLFNAFTGN